MYNKGHDRHRQDAGVTTPYPPSPTSEPPAKSMVVMPTALKAPASPDSIDKSVSYLRMAMAATTPLLDMRGDGVATTAAAAEEVFDPSANDPFYGIIVESGYRRPNGMTYVPRSMQVKERTVQDVTFIRSAAAAGLPVLLYGPPGTGKTALVEAAMPRCLTIQGTIETETADFIGSWVQSPDGKYHWIDGPLVRAADDGVPLLIDEIALIDPRSLAVVYGAMDGRDEIVVTQNPSRGVVKVNPGFIVFGAFNPDVPGAVTSDALMSRFPVQIEVQTDWNLARSLHIPPKIIQVARNLNHKVASGELTSAPQLRELLAYRDLFDRYGEEFALRNFIGQIRPENRSGAIAAVKSVFGTEPAALAL